MRKYKIKILLLVVVITMAIISACEMQNEVLPEVTSAPDLSATTVEEVTVGLWGLYEPQSEASIFITDYIKDVYKLNIKPIPLSNENYQSEIDWMVSSNMLPDIFAHDVIANKLQYKVLITSGQIQSIPRNLWASYERLSAVMSWYENGYSYNDEMYFIPRTYQTFDQTHGASSVIMYRSDWAKDLTQATFGDTANFIDVIRLLSAYRNSDIDKNSIWDTWGITGYGGLKFIREAFLVPFGVDDWVLEDGKWIPGIISLQAKEAISWAAQLYREGIIDPDIGAQTEQEALKKFFTGKSGAILTSAYYEDLLMFEKEWKAYNTDIDISSSVRIIPSYTTPQGTRNNGISTFEGGSMISSNVSEGKLNKILGLFDFLLGSDGRSLVEYGSPSTPDATGGAKTFLNIAPEFSSFANLASWNLDKNPSSAMVDSEFMVYAQETLQKNIWPWSFDEELFTNGMITPEMCILDIDRIAEEKILYLIKTTREFDVDWDSYVESMYKELNLDEAILEVNANADEYFLQEKDE